MIASLHLQDFRRFDNHDIPFRPATLLVGPNNAGKSTIIEALRLAALVLRIAPNGQFVPPPEWTQQRRVDVGVRPSLTGRGFNLRTAIRGLRDPPARITLRYESGASVEVLVSPEDVFGIIRAPDGNAVKSRTAFRALGLEHIAIQPQAAPVLLEEELRDPDYVRRSIGSTRAPQHFRNQLLDADEAQFRAFVMLAETTWPSLQIKERYAQDGRAFLVVRDRGFAGDIGLMGHGLQMWLQLMWFLTQERKAPIVILDEPDVYMHADLQRGLLRHVRSRHVQVIVATHSAEMMSDVSPDEVVVIDADQTASPPAGSLEAVQRAVDQMGSVHNLQLARLARARRCLLVEGKDLQILEALHATIAPDSPPLGTSPSWPIGGWGGFHYAVGSSMAMRNAAGEHITTYCLLDRDYHLDEEIKERELQAQRRHVELHVWQRKEIENYLLVPSAIGRIVRRDIRKGRAPDDTEVADRLNKVAEDLRNEVHDCHLEAFQQTHRGKAGKPAAQYARKIMEARYDSAAERFRNCPGKTVLREMRGWIQRRWGVSITAGALAAELRPEEIDRELREVLRAIDRAEPI